MMYQSAPMRPHRLAALFMSFAFAVIGGSVGLNALIKYVHRMCCKFCMCNSKDFLASRSNQDRGRIQRVAEALGITVTIDDKGVSLLNLFHRATPCLTRRHPVLIRCLQIRHCCDNYLRPHRPSRPHLPYPHSSPAPLVLVHLFDASDHHHFAHYLSIHPPRNSNIHINVAIPIIHLGVLCRLALRRPSRVHRLRSEPAGFHYRDVREWAAGPGEYRQRDGEPAGS